MPDAHDCRRYAIGSADLPASRLCADCRNGTTGNCTSAANPVGFLMQQVNVWTSASVLGPWAKTATLGKEPAWDNPAPFIFANGSAIVMWRGTADSKLGSIALGRAADWRQGPFDAGASTPIFPPSTNFTVPAEPCLSDPAYKRPCAQTNIEDPHVWRSRSTGHFHALFHNGCDHDCPHIGRHAWSRDGSSWTLSHNIAYTADVAFTDGTSVQSKRRERPHVILSNVTGEPVALVTALFARTVNGRSPYPAPRSDYAWTLIQTIEH